MTIHNGLGKLTPSADFLYGDGLRSTDQSGVTLAGVIPNGVKLPSYIVANFGIGQAFDGPGALKGLSIRFDIVNLFDKRYLIRDGLGVGVGAPQYGAPRGFFVGLRKSF